MSKFLVFSGFNYYPFGGWEDFKGAYDTIEEAKKHEMEQGGWQHIVDIGERTIVTSREWDYTQKQPTIWS